MTVLAFAVVTLIVSATAALAAPTFPPLSGRVVDQANILSPQAEQQLTDQLATLEKQTGRQLVVATLSSLQGYEIEDYGYQLGRAWGIGEKDRNTGALLIVAPAERKVRIEVGYGLEPVLTDALSSVIIQSAILPRFRAGDMEGGIVAGTDAIVKQLSLPDGEARAQVAQAAEGERQDGGGGVPIVAIFIAVIVGVMILRAMFGRRRRRSGLGAAVGEALPWILINALSSSGRGGGGGGGFSGGGGSFGGGGSSGSW
ncbi:methanol dehydrogenase [Caulobacter endophyticus]|uniref:Methanol dehydrogenase n=1 Tax=Caulobacter endophyticus TaxID=2172652 RepID=A0A2T9JPW5_9CAUL|nr:TPM domain-containing protein [Caulobacter endophyticus]PVM85733.1 methanol dehydrogenase [Caulobacter endophyticus]